MGFGKKQKGRMVYVPPNFVQIMDNQKSLNKLETNSDVFRHLEKIIIGRQK